MSTAADGPIPIDGRTARSVRTRKAIVEACIALVEEGDLEPTAPRVAERAGVSVRSVFQHFDDLEGLFAAVGDRVLENLLGLVMHVDPTIDFERRVPIVVRQRTALLEALAPIRRAVAVNAWDSQEVSNRLALGHAYLRLEIESAFARELLAAGDDRMEVLNALDTVLSWSTWEQLRTAVGLDAPGAAAVVERLCRATLAAYR
jgi:TetR/AcrR family transcriptional regulator of autoinduction and epiphytic fitness